MPCSEGNIIGHADTVAESTKEADPKPEEEGAEGSQKPLEGVEGSQKPTEEGSKKPLEEGAEGVDKPNLDEDTESIKKPELTGPFGVQDKGEITNATGQVIGHLQEGTPQDLVGTSIKEIDEEGNLKNKSGSVVGKAELNPEVLEKSGSALPEGSQVPGSEAAEGVEGEKPEVPEGEELAEGEKPEVKEGEELAEGEKPEVKEGEELAEGEKPEGEELPEGEAEVPDLSILKDKTVNKLGKIVDADGNPFGILVEGEAKKLAG
jgi:hypothetical protein